MPGPLSTFPRFGRPPWPATSPPPPFANTETGDDCDAAPVGPSLSFRRGTEGEVAGHRYPRSYECIQRAGIYARAEDVTTDFRSTLQVGTHPPPFNLTASRSRLTATRHRLSGNPSGFAASPLQLAAKRLVLSASPSRFAGKPVRLAAYRVRLPASRTRLPASRLRLPVSRIGLAASWPGRVPRNGRGASIAGRGVARGGEPWMRNRR
jgi:hypothetical protein